jgi:hypothetical protein
MLLDFFNLFLFSLKSIGQMPSSTTTTIDWRRGPVVGGQICDICLSVNCREFVLLFQKFSLKFECLPFWAILLVKN